MLNITTFKPQNIFQDQLSFAQFCVNTTFDGLERVVLLNLASSRTALEMALSTIAQLTGARDLQSILRVQEQYATPAIERGVEYSRNIMTITHETKNKLSSKVESEVAATSSKVNRLVEESLANAPAGSEAAVAAVKSAMKVANDTMDGLSQAARKVNEVTEASVAAATTATARTATALSKKAA